MKRNLNIIFFLLSCMILGGCKKIMKTADNIVGENVLSKGGKEISKEAAEKSAKEFGNSYVGKSVGHQLVRNAVRKKVEKEMKEEGVKSFLQFGSKKASKELAHISVPSAKAKMLNKENRYHNQLIALRQNRKKTNQKDLIFKDAAFKEVKIIARMEGKEAMQYLSVNNPELKELVEKVVKNSVAPTSWEKIIVEVGEDGKIFMKHKEWVNCRIEVDGDIIRASAGAKNPDHYENLISYGRNEFLSHRLPNKTYIIDDYMSITTDELGRVKETSAVFEKDKIIWRTRKSNNTEEQNRIVESQGGVVGRDDGGHLIQMSMGGPNELINQVPMDKHVNRSGIWKMVEKYEIEQGWEQGKKVISKRRPIYKGNSRRPVAFEIDIIVDGKHAIINGKQCPFTIPNE